MTLTLPPSLRSIAAATLLGLASFGVSSAAQADIRIWEDQPEDEEQHRWLELTGYLQPGFIWRQNDVNSPLDDDGFIVQRVRWGFRAQTHKYLRIRVELENTPNTNLTDAFVDGVFHPAFNVRFGQFQLAFLRTYEFGEQFIGFNDRLVYTTIGQDRAYLRYLRPRDVGLMVHGRLGADTAEGSDSPALEYAVGAFLGRGANQVVNEDEAFLYSARLAAHLLGVPHGFNQESDLARNPDPKLLVGAGVYSNCDDRGQFNRGWTSDLELRYEGLYASATFMWFKNGPVEGDGLGASLGYREACGATQTPEHIAWGTSGQVQYVLPPALTGDTQAWEILARYDQVAPQNPCNAETGECGFFGFNDPETPGYQQPSNYNDADNPPSSYRLTVGVNWFPTNDQSLRLGLNYQMNRETEEVGIAGQTIKAIKNDILWLQLTAGI